MPRPAALALVLLGLCVACTRTPPERPEQTAKPTPEQRRDDGPRPTYEQRPCLDLEPPELVKRCFDTTSLSPRERRALAKRIAEAPSPRREEITAALFGSPRCSSARCDDELALHAFESTLRSLVQDVAPGDVDDATWCDAVSAFCVEEEPRRALLPRCVRETGDARRGRRCMSVEPYAKLLQATFGARDEAADEVTAWLTEVMIDEGDPAFRGAMVDALVASGTLTATAARWVPQRDELERRARAMLRKRGLDPDDLCEGDLRILEEKPPGTLILRSDGNRCPDGPLILMELSIGPGGWRVIKAVAGHTG